MKRIFLILLVFFTCVPLIISTGQKEGKAVAKPIELQFWYFGGLNTELEYYPTVIEKFSAANPDIKVNSTKFPWDSRHEKVVVGSQRNSLPDVMGTHTLLIPDFVEMGLLEPLDVTYSEYVKKWEPRFVPEIWDKVGVYKEHRYCVPPYVAMAPFIIYKPRVFAAAGVDPVFKDWEDIKMAARRLKTNDRAGIAIAATMATNDAQYFIDLALLNGGRWLSADGKKSDINGRGVVDTMKFYLELYKEGLTQPTPTASDYIDVSKLLIQDRAAFHTCQDGSLGVIYDLGAPREEKFALARVPKPKVVTGKHPPAAGRIEGGCDLMIFSSSKVKDSAIKFLDFWAQPEVLNAWQGEPIIGRTPTIKNAYNEVYKKHLPSLYQAYEQGVLFEGLILSPAFPGLAEMYTYLGEAIQRVFLEEETPQSALDKAQVMCQEVVDRFLKK